MALTAEQQTRFAKAIEMLRPEAKEFTDQMLNDRMKTTQNNYGRVMAFISDLESKKRGFGMLFLLAMEKEGYPLTTSNQIKQLMGW